MSESTHDSLRDSGVQVERTRLAWQRTVLALCGAAVLALRGWAHENPAARLIVGAGLIGVAGAALGLLSSRRQRLQSHALQAGSSSDASSPGAGSLLAVVLFAAILAAAHLILLIKRDGR
ncbi:DUF202 domain-containing protein [Pedococcus sp. P5_B7]